MMRTMTTLFSLFFISVVTACGNDKNRRNHDTGSPLDSEASSDAGTSGGTESGETHDGGTDDGGTDDGGTGDGGTGAGTTGDGGTDDGQSIEDSGTTDTGTDDTGTAVSDTGEAGTIDTAGIDIGTRISGYILPEISFGEITWEKATSDGSHCKIQGLMSEIILLEEACDTCDWGATFTVTGMAIIVDEGACDLSILGLDGMVMTFGHGYTPLDAEDGSDHYQLFQRDEGVWGLRENGFSVYREVEEPGMDMWAFGEEFFDGSEDDAIDDDEASSWIEWQSTINTTDLNGLFTYELYEAGESCTISGEITDVLMSDTCVDCAFSASFTLAGLSASPTASECGVMATDMEGTSKSAGHGRESLYPGVPTDDRYVLWDDTDTGWSTMDSGWSTFEAETSEWTFGERIVAE